MTLVITQNGVLINRGEWDYGVLIDERITNPYTGEAPAPDDWDYGIVVTETITSPLPEGAIEEDLDVFYDAKGVMRLVRDAPAFEAESRFASYSAELAELMIDIQLAMASPEEIERAKYLRTFLKENPLP